MQNVSSVTKKRRYLNIAMCLYAVYLGLYDLIEVSAFSWMHNAGYLMLGIILMFVAIDWINRGARLVFRWDIIVWIPFFFVVLFSVLYHVCAWHYLILFFISLAIISSIDGIKSVEVIARYMLFFATFYFITQCVQLFALPIYSVFASTFFRPAAAQAQINSSYIAGLTAQVSHTAIYLILGIGTVACLKNKKLAKYKLLLVLYFIGMFLIKKRMHLVLTIAALLIIYVISVDNPSKRINRILLILFIAAIGIIGFIAFKPVLSKIDLLERFYQTIDSFIAGGSDEVIKESGRGVLYQTAWQLFEDNPSGIGWGRFVTVLAEQMGGYSTSVHNIYLQLLCETGVQGLVFFLIPLIFNFCLCVRNIVLAKKKALKDTVEYKYATLSFFIQFIWIIYGLTGNPLYNENYLIMYFLSLMFMMPLREKIKKCTSKTAGGTLS